MILFCFNIVSWASDIHEATNGEDHEHERQLMRHERIIHLRGSIGVIELAKCGFVELRRRDWIVPARKVSDVEGKGCD